jgi:leucyl aminopeptidase
MVMAARLDLRLRVLLPIVENSIAGNAFRPGDVLVCRNGVTTEVGNTDAEGRLILADALVLASEADPELLIDMATLTGASRVALGTDVPSIFANDDALAQQLQALSATVDDQLWQLPLWQGYRKQLKSTVADLRNVGAGAYGGAITAALYLSEFVGPRAKPGARAAGGDDGDGEADEPAEGGSARPRGPQWVHMDVMAYNTGSSPGRPEGGEAMGMRAFYELLRQRYAPVK